MTNFPTELYANAALYLDAYAQEISAAFRSVDRDCIEAAAICLRDAAMGRKYIFSCGNGGSCAIANHLVCDYLKGIQNGTSLQPRVVSLSSNLETVTAVANDISYDDVFAFQLKSLASPGDVLIVITSSGNSPNILRALSWAKGNGVKTIAMTGFSGGDAKAMADIPIHVAAENYGIVEDVHQSLMHLLAQYLRLSHLQDVSRLAHCKF